MRLVPSRLSSGTQHKQAVASGNISGSVNPRKSWEKAMTKRKTVSRDAKVLCSGALSVGKRYTAQSLRVTANKKDPSGNISRRAFPINSWKNAR